MMKPESILIVLLALIFVMTLTACDNTSALSENNDEVEVYNIELSRDNLNWIEVSGQVENRTEEDLSYVSISVFIYDENDNRVGSGYTNKSNVGIGESFEWLATTAYDGEYDYYEVEFEYSY